MSLECPWKLVAVSLNDHLATLKLQSEEKMAPGAIHIDI
jgi:hypothetical protein